ncbi:hypothetical protein PMI16_03421 [Herbaspirillum sp. CF444]|uniref:hypothetical protein n=1 Tax=Herbaspirillum sp. CF444 TaxID=1144319 RepID=UPI0002727EC9|nr:hypothetical protein [Herbaspirillum sp. CF444]EJL85641.1 hypothetical protein PMI16_03421 [Herbaspirillum sp. CF444]
MKFIKKVKAVAVGTALAVGALVGGPVYAATNVDLTPITSSFTATDITAGVLAIAATLAVVYVTIKSSKIVLGMLRGG